MLNKNIEYSRHAKRRMKLYNISEESVLSIITQACSENAIEEGKHELISDNIFTEYGHPIKIVFSCEKNKIIVITAYPLKKGVKS